MDLRRLRYFIVLAEERNFTRAAARLGIQQPPLSMQIRQLESEIGAPLLHRRSRGLELTGAGTGLLADARQILAQVDRAAASAQSLARGATGRLRVGFAGATYLPPDVHKAIMRYRKAFPDVVLEPDQSNTPALVRGLHDGSVDVAFIRPPAPMAEGIRVTDFLEEEMLAVLPCGHALAGEDPIGLAALAHETFILFPRDVGPGLYDSIVAACNNAGFSPILGQAASQIVSAVPMVSAGFGVSVVPRSIAALGIRGVVYRRLQDSALVAPIAVARRTDDQSAVVAHFVAAMRRSG